MAFTPFVLLDDNLSDAGDLVSVEVFKQLAENLNYLIDAMPVGSIVPIMDGFPGVPTPDPTIWHPCDGTLITEPESPLRNSNAPDYAAADGRYMRGFVTAGAIGNYGGSNTKTLSHSHGGQTDGFGPPTSADTDDDFAVASPHHHPLLTDLTTPINFEPVHYRVKHYIKIR